MKPHKSEGLSKVFFILTFVSFILGLIFSPPINYFLFGFAVLMVIVGTIFSEIPLKKELDKEVKIQELEEKIKEEKENIKRMESLKSQEDLEEDEIKSKIEKQLEEADRKLKKDIPEKPYLDLTEEVYCNVRGTSL